MKIFALILHALQWLVLSVWSIFWITAAFLAALVTLNGGVPLIMARRIWSSLCWRIAGATLTVEPLPSLDWSKPYIFVMNHQSALDIPCAFAALPVNIRFVAKHVLKYVPFLGWYMAMTGMIFINRSNRHEAVRSLARAGERIRAGSSILIYPEGTRSKDGLILPLKKGPFVLALEAQVPIVPVAIEGSGQVLPAGSLRLRPHPIRVKVGQPIPTAGRDPEDKDALLRDVRNALIRLHQEIGGKGGVTQEIASVGQEGMDEVKPAKARHAG